jgi:hypothetical protein
MRDARGRTVYDVPLPAIARLLPTTEVAQLVGSALATLNRNPRLPPTTATEYRRALAVPARVPAVSQLVVRNDGSVLLRPWLAVIAKDVVHRAAGRREAGGR